MAYAAVNTLDLTIKRLQDSSITPQIKASAHHELGCLRSVLEKLNETRNRSINMSLIDALDAEIREAVFKLEDVFESYVLHYPVDDESLTREINSFSTKSTELREEYERALTMLSEDDGDRQIDDGFGENNPSTTVGLPDQVDEILKKLLNFECSHMILSLVGMAGIGKTHLARVIYHHPLIAQHFHVKVWVRVGRKSRARKILADILAQIECKPRDVFMEQEIYTLLTLLMNLENRLHGLRIIIFFDDVWSDDVLNDVIDSFPDVEVRFFLTTRIEDAAYKYNRFSVKGNHDPGIHHMRFLNNEESWKLLRENVFGDEYCSPEMEIAGKKIAENCEGLPLLILTVADILCGFDKTQEYWNKVAEMKTTTFPDAFDRIWEVLYSSYEFLPQELKPCFLYMGVFPRRFEILRSRLIHLLIVEDFLTRDYRFANVERYYIKCLNGVVGNSLAIRCKQSSNGGIKSFRIHSAYWYLCVKEAKKIKFFHVLKRLCDAYAEGIESQRRLSVQNNMLLGIEEAYNSMAAVQTMRSLLFTGADHQYPVPVCLDLVFLKVLDALAIRFYEFPIEVVKLFRLKYLALTHNGVLPSSISNLQSLQSLILRQHHAIKFVRDSTSLPKEIWDMRELKHLRIMRNNLPDPTNNTMLSNLSTLCVDACSCSENIFRGTTGLKKLGIYIELLPDAAGIPSCFEHVNLLEKLVSLTCVVVNPRVVVVAPPNHLSNLVSGLKKLSLSGLGYSWDCITAIGSLPELEVLKLRCCAFRGPVWKAKAIEFQSLRFLLLEDMDLVQWTADEDSEEDPDNFSCLFVSIRHLIIRHCYKLKAIPWQIGKIECLKKIELVECSNSVVDSARKIREEKEYYSYSCEVVITSSWNR